MNYIIETKDLSPTIFSEQFQQTYHSIHGAIAESDHVFIRHGLDLIHSDKQDVAIFEMGFGTGLNAALTWLYALERNKSIHYYTIEKYPLEPHLISQYTTENEHLNNNLQILQETQWNVPMQFPSFHFTKYQEDILNLRFDFLVDIIYYDAFAPSSQPELWTDEVFRKMYKILQPNGILSTYCAKGEVKRSLKRCGFNVFSPPGPRGKREMTVACKGDYKF